MDSYKQFADKAEECHVMFILSGDEKDGDMVVDLNKATKLQNNSHSIQ